MYDKILIISDNVYLCARVEEILLSLSVGIKFEIAISPFSDIIDFKQNLKSQVFVKDLRDDKCLSEILNSYNLVFSIHCKQIFPTHLVQNIKCINVHPGYNPINRGWYPQVFAIINNLKVGATIHEIDDNLDHGPIIARELVEVKSEDTSETLYNRLVVKEIELFQSNILSIINNQYRAIKPEFEGELYLKKNFNELCNLNLDEVTTMSKCINRLRALTHGKFKNAFFIDEATGKKIYVSINLEKEK